MGFRKGSQLCDLELCDLELICVSYAEIECKSCGSCQVPTKRGVHQVDDV